MRNNTIARWTAALACLLTATPALAGPSTTSRAADQLLGVATLSAVVQSNGILARHVGVDTASRLALGQYEVIFERDVSKCTYAANTGHTEAATPNFGVVVVASRSGNANGVFVKTLNHDAVQIDSSFHLIVFCGY